MRSAHILFRCKARKITLISRQNEPCRRNRINRLCRQKHFVQRIVSAHAVNGMPCQIDRIIFRNTRIFRLYIICHRHRLFAVFLRQPLILYISDIRILCFYFCPVLHFLQNDNAVTFFHIRQDIAFNTALISHLRIFENVGDLPFVPFRIHLHMIWL